MILIYSHTQTPRLTYIARFLFSSILGVPVSLTSDTNEFKNYKFPKINYSSETLEGISIYPHNLLFQQGLDTITPEFLTCQNIPALFPVSQPSALPFDPFAAAFFMVTRYEEYKPSFLDHHGRYLPTESIAYKHHFLEIPVVDQWALLLKSLVQQRYPEFHFPERQYRFVPTIDVDVAYAYKYRNFFRMAGASLKSLLKGNFRDNKRRFNTLFLNHPDPYDTFELLRDWHQRFNLNPRFFFLVGRYGKYDKNLSPHHKAIQELIRQTSERYSVGIHPSYQSNFKSDQVEAEIKTLGNIINKPIIQSRQHFLMLRFPKTYQHLIKCDIKEDYTMGYAQLPGFRAGTCTPFPFYDLTTETETALTVYPFQLMDGTLNQYLKLSPLEAIDCIRRLNNEVRKVSGTFMSLWHNESLSQMRKWKNWQEVYEALLKIAS